MSEPDPRNGRLARIETLQEASTAALNRVEASLREVIASREREDTQRYRFLEREFSILTGNIADVKTAQNLFANSMDTRLERIETRLTSLETTRSEVRAGWGVVNYIVAALGVSGIAAAVIAIVKMLG